MNEHNIFLTGCYCFLALFAVLIFIFWLIWKYGTRNAINSQEFENLYESIEKMIADLDVSAENSKTILIQLDKLDHLKYRDKEKRNELYDRFWAKFEAKASNIMKNHFIATK